MNLRSLEGGALSLPHFVDQGTDKAVPSKVTPVSDHGVTGSTSKQSIAIAPRRLE